MEIEQTARPLETNVHANFPLAENAAYQCMENAGGNHSHIDMFVARFPREHAEHFLCIVGHTNAEQRYH